MGADCYSSCKMETPRMAKSSLVNELSKRIEQLRAERQQHLDAVAEIDRTFTELGIEAQGGAPVRRGPGRPRKVTKAAQRTTKKTRGRRRRGRGSYSETAEQFILGLLPAGKKLSTAEINKAWKETGRGGSANNTLSKMTKAGSVKKQNIKGGRGSYYTAA